MFYSGDKIGPYTLIRYLGQGGFGVVWLAEKRTPITSTNFALKLTLDENQNIDAIRREAELWKQASGHPNILPIIEADIYNGRVVIVSEYAPDGSLEEWLKKHQAASIPIEKTIEIVSGILAGLSHLHERRIIHRDLKPANILLQGEVPRLADFGIARVIQTNNLNSTALGTPPYMAPESFNGARSAQTDLWSAGVIFYELLAGYLPFIEQDLMALMTAITAQDLRPLPNHIPKSLQRIISCALDKNLQHRYRSAKEMLYALREVSSDISFNNASYRTTVMVQPQINNSNEYVNQLPPGELKSDSFLKRTPQVPTPAPYPAPIALNQAAIPNGPIAPATKAKILTRLYINQVWMRRAFIVLITLALTGLAISTYYHFAARNQEPGSIFGDFAGREAVITNATNVNLRSEPEGSILAIMPQGTRVRLLEDRGKWLRIKIIEWAGEPPPNAPDSGWVISQFVTR